MDSRESPKIFKFGITSRDPKFEKKILPYRKTGSNSMMCTMMRQIHQHFEKPGREENM